MYWLYSILLVFWGILLIPALLYRAWRHKKYLPGLTQRLGNLPSSLKFEGRRTIWFHACSVGETLSLQPLVSDLHSLFPEARFVFSTITKTGQLMAVRDFGQANAFYFPLDLASICRRVLKWIRPEMIVIVDTEIWPNLLHQAAAHGIPVVLANGRISASSFRHYRWAKPVMRRVFRDYRLLMMQSDEDAQRIRAIGAPSEKVLVTGNIKFAKSMPERKPSGKAACSLAEFCRCSEGPLIVAGSTHEGEELILLKSLRQVRSSPGLGSTRLLIAPRHPERFEQVAAMVQASGFTLRKRTGDVAQPAEILLLDTLGELAAVYSFATLVFIGGTLNRHGGHSIIEPALHSRPIVVGPCMDNFQQVIEEFRNHGAVRQIGALPNDPSFQADQLTRVFVNLLQNEHDRESLGKAAFSILEKNRGAARITVERIAAIFAQAYGDGCSTDSIPAVEKDMIASGKSR